jgi:hypothetical protein
LILFELLVRAGDSLVGVVEEETLSVSSSDQDLGSTRRDATLLWSRSSESAVCRLKNSDSSGWHQRIMDGMVVVKFVGVSVARECDYVLPDKEEQEFDFVSIVLRFHHKLTVTIKSCDVL